MAKLTTRTARAWLRFRHRGGTEIVYRSDGQVLKKRQGQGWKLLRKWDLSQSLRTIKGLYKAEGWAEVKVEMEEG